MPTKAPKVRLDDRILDAQIKASHWLADGNKAFAAGRVTKADRYFQKARFWLDRANHLSGQGESPAPSR
ncbi:MAG: hypothetical protein EOO39_19215 [Cytophagaceae bacterium]|nr:MAG: hypothetical protein EOO39_19215 [Cytophagaceae bacterium]